MRKSFISESEKSGFVKIDHTFVHNKWIKKGDKVVVTSGNSRGCKGEVMSRDKNHVLIRGVNLHKKHRRREGDQGPGVIDTIEMPIHVSNVSICNGEGKPVRLKVRMTEGKKELYYMDGSKEVLHRKL
ncbi:MAG: 50S ribosomal protein L24 [Chlamydiae bacterium]|nr:50S ribosomal protein L24 [Chlamydiota bacterium]